jgi:Amt family ammonium transporter
MHPQTPAMGIAQAGLIRAKNSLSMLLQVSAGASIGAILWFIFGFSVVFGTQEFRGVISNPVQ